MASRIAVAPRDPELWAQTARDGTASITASRNGFERIQIHSRYRPTEEARRAVAALPATATCVVHGLGGAFIPRAYLAEYRESCVVVTERAASTVRTVFEEVDLVTELHSGRLRVATNREELATTLESVHLPAVRDGIHVTELTSWVSRKPHRDHFLALHDAITATLHSIAAEMATMRHFGRPWLSHTVENSLRVRWESVPSGIEQYRRKRRGAATRVLAAGPSLDYWFLEHPLSD